MYLLFQFLFYVHSVFRSPLCSAPIIYTYTPSSFVTHHLSHSTLSHTTVLTFRSFTTSCAFPSFSVPATTFGAHYWKKLPCGVIRSFNSFLPPSKPGTISRRLKNKFSSTSLAIVLTRRLSQVILHKLTSGYRLSRFLTNISASARRVTVICVTQMHLTRLDHCSETTQSSSSACFALRRLWPLTRCALCAQSGVAKAIHLFLLWAKKRARCSQVFHDHKQQRKGSTWWTERLYAYLISMVSTLKVLHGSRESILNVKYLIALVIWVSNAILEGSLEVKLPTIWTDEKQSWAEAERRGE